MKFEIKVGRGYVANDIVISIHAAEQRPKRSLKRILIYCGVASTGAILVAAVAHGAVTGDYTVLRSAAEAGKDLLVEVAARAAKGK